MLPRVRPVDTIATRLVRAGDRIDLHGEPNRFGGRSVVTAIERDASGFVAKRPGWADARYLVLADLLTDLTPEDAERDGWEYGNGAV